MPNILFIKKLFIMTDNEKKCFLTELSDSVNIVYGRNTSGKSTLIQSILFSFGINDVKPKLRELLELKVVFRVDLDVKIQSTVKNYTFVRDNEFLVIKCGDGKILRFNGVGSDNAVEHLKLKKFWNELLDSNLMLENNSGLSIAPIEALFLPYYVSQDVGWVYLRKSFANLDFYKSFKEVFLDYYLGVENFVNLTKKREVESQILNLKEKINVLMNMEKSQPEILHARLSDEKQPEVLEKYIEEYSGINADVICLEKDLVLKCNELSYWQERRSILSKVSKNHSEQHRESSVCPICSQKIPVSFESIYKFEQEINDTNAEIELSKTKTREIQSLINSLKKKIDDNRKSLKEKYEIFETRKENVTVNTWIKDKAYQAMDKKISEEIGSNSIRLDALKEELKLYSEEDNVRINRLERISRFKAIFKSCLIDIGIKIDMESRFYDIYALSAFPAQGVELHKIITAYYLSLNYLIKECSFSHRLPLMLDAIFKEDLEAVNKEYILKFLSKWKPADTQIIFSVSDSPKDKLRAKNYNEKYFSNKAKMICIGDGNSERCLLKDTVNSDHNIIRETKEIFEQN